MKRKAFLSPLEDSVQLADRAICNVQITLLFGLTIHIVHTAGLVIIQQ